MTHRTSLRTFHNWIKDMLIHDVAKRVRGTRSDQSVGLHLLDFGCGCGQDLHKWNKTNIEFVVGVDPDNTSIQEAWKRMSSMRPYGNYNFIQEIPLTYLENHPPSSYQIVTCMFAIHYLTKPELVLFFRRVSELLVSGGRLVITFVSATTVLKLLGKDNGLTTPCIQIELVDHTKMAIRLNDTLYFGDTEVSEEHLVFPSNLDQMANMCNLQKEDDLSMPFSRWYDKCSNTKRDLTIDEKTASFMYQSVVYMKS